MDIKAEIEKIVNRIKNDKNLLNKFQTEPVKAIEEILGCDLPDEAVEKIIAGVKAKLAAGEAKGILSKLAGLFGKKN